MRIEPFSWICLPCEISLPSWKQEATIDRLSSLEVSSKKSVISESFHQFLDEYETEIFPFYEKHEKTFDNIRVHSRMHVARALIFCEVMARYYTVMGIEVNFPLLRRAIGLHDAGRQGNGEDIWEKDSAKILASHLRKKGVGYFTANKQANIIVKDGTDKKYPIEYFLAQSGDCLDIMRLPMGPGPKNGFREELLTFMNHEGCASKGLLRKQLIEEVWRFVQETEKRKFAPEFSKSKGFMQNLFQIIDRGNYPLLSTILSKKEFDFSFKMVFPSTPLTTWLVEKIPTRRLRWIAWFFLLPFQIFERFCRNCLSIILD
ncbi:MAG: hypothetical protein K940chlam6_00252 [Chlamydiae bacterium]|nr:hypothetical protein [Chlamydiota bacterium]